MFLIMALLPSSMLGLGGRWYLMGSSGQWHLLGLSAAPPPSFVVVLTCNDDHKKKEGFLFKRDPWDSFLVAFNA